MSSLPISYAPNCYNPFNQNYVSIISRIKSFDKLPVNNDLIDYKQYATAGFYYHKSECMCFFCGVKCEINKENNPFVEHCLINPTCTFIRVNKHLIKGQPIEQPSADKIPEELICKCCLDAKVSYVNITCGHVACCSNCVCTQETCHICRANISSVMKVFI